jgi:transposase
VLAFNAPINAMMTPQPTREAQLTEDVTALRATNKAQEITIHAQRIEIKLLREKIDLLVRRIFGKSSEQIDEQQLMLLLQGDDSATKKDLASDSDATGLEAELAKGSKELKARPPRAERKPRIPDHLPVSEEIIVDPDEVKAAPEAYRHVNDEVTEQLDFIPPQFTKRLIIRRKYVKRDEPHQAPIIAPLDTLAERSIAAPGLLAQIIVAKYCDHLPLYRQEQIYKLRHSIDLPRQSMARWIGLAAEWFAPLYERIHTGVMAGGYVQTDETMIEYLQPGNGQTKQGYFWTLKRPGGDAVFVWRTSRATSSLSNIIAADFSGTIGCDGYSVYQSHATASNGRIRLAACWAHVRRKFDEAKAGHARPAASVLLLIQQLYRIEKQLRKSKARAKLRQVKRAAHSRMIVHRIGTLLKHWKTKGTFLPQSLMGKAIDYTLTLWAHLQVYLEDGRIEIDNNLVENAIRPTAVGKKNWLFIGDADTGERSAIMFTIIEACRSRQIDPWEYLRDVLTRLPSMTTGQLHEVMPEAWAIARRAKQQSPAAARVVGQSQAVG